MEGYCSVCGKRLGMFVSFCDLKNGNICSDCVKKAGFNFNSDDDITTLENLRVEDIVEKISFIEENRFRPNTVCSTLAFDDDKMVLRVNENGCEYYYNYQDIVSYEYLKDDKPEITGGIGGAAIGSIFGLPGMIIGGALGSGILGKYVNSITIRFVTNDHGVRTHNIQLLNERVSETSTEFTNAEAEAYKMVTAFDHAAELVKGAKYESIVEPVIERKVEKPVEQKATIQVNEPKKTTSIADEILRYKELLDCGAITKEEFDAVKKKLLGI